MYASPRGDTAAVVKAGIAITEGQLFDDDCLDGTFVSGLLDGLLELRRDHIDLHLGQLIAQLKDVRTGITTKPTGGASIFDFDCHNTSPLTNHRSLKLAIIVSEWRIVNKKLSAACQICGNSFWGRLVLPNSAILAADIAPISLLLALFEPMQGHKLKIGKIDLAVAVYVACDDGSAGRLAKI